MCYLSLFFPGIYPASEIGFHHHSDSSVFGPARHAYCRLQWLPSAVHSAKAASVQRGRAVRGIRRDTAHISLSPALRMGVPSSRGPLEYVPAISVSASLSVTLPRNDATLSCMSSRTKYKANAVSDVLLQARGLYTHPMLCEISLSQRRCTWAPFRAQSH